MPLRDHLETIANDLRDPEFSRDYLQLAWEDETPTFLTALRNVATVNLGMTRLSEITGMSRESLYKTLSPSGNPHLSTIRKILQALNYDLMLENNFMVSEGDVKEASAPESVLVASS